MIQLHAIRPVIHNDVLIAAAKLLREHPNMRFRSTGQPYLGNHPSVPVQYYYNDRWNDWTGNSIRGWNDLYRSPSETELQRAREAFD